MWQNFLLLKKHYLLYCLRWYVLGMSTTIRNIYIYIYIYIVFDMSIIICMACIEMQKLTVDVLEDFLEANFNPINRVYNSIGVKLRIMMYIDFKI